MSEKKTREQKTENKISRASIFKKKQLPFILNELNDAMFCCFHNETLEIQNLFQFAAVNENLKILHISAVFLFGEYQYSLPGNVYILSKF